MKTKIQKLKFVRMKDDDAYVYGGFTGAFGTAKIEGDKLIQDREFYTCREEFWDAFDNRTKNLLMKIGDAEEFPRIQKFINEIEKRLKLGVRSKLKIERLEKNIILIRLSKWWWNNNLRRDFLTAALRHGRFYTGNFEKALDSQDYFNHTKRAVEKFLNGFTKFKQSRRRYSGDSFGGWVDSFYQDEYDDPTNQLIK